MNSPLNGLRVACAVFGVVSLLQLVRLLAGAEVSVDGHLVPLWASGVAFLVAGGLSAWMARLSYRGTN
jgi:hypothetical protein